MVANQKSKKKSLNMRKNDIIMVDKKDNGKIKQS